MIDICQLIKSQLNNNAVAAFDVDSLAQLPCYVYWKDKKGNYLDGNDYIINHAGLNVVGLSDFDFCDYDSAQQLHANDELVMAQMTPRFFVEQVHYVNGRKVIPFSYKAPIHNRLQKTIGIVGVSFLTEYDEGVIPHQNADIFKQQINSFDNLTAKEKEILYWLVKGQTCAGIGNTIQLSVRTVEFHLANIKAKLNVRKKSELISLITNKFTGNTF